jgi:hypothetical protein
MAIFLCDVIKKYGAYQPPPPPPFNGPNRISELRLPPASRNGSLSPSEWGAWEGGGGWNGICGRFDLRSAQNCTHEQARQLLEEGQRRGWWTL